MKGHFYSFCKWSFFFFHVFRRSIWIYRLWKTDYLPWLNAFLWIIITNNFPRSIRQPPLVQWYQLQACLEVWIRPLLGHHLSTVLWLVEVLFHPLQLTLEASCRQPICPLAVYMVFHLFMLIVTLSITVFQIHKVFTSLWCNRTHPCRPLGKWISTVYIQFLDQF